MTSNLNSNSGDADSSKRRRRQLARRYSFIGIVSTMFILVISGIGFGVHTLFAHSNSVLVKDVSVTATDAETVSDDNSTQADQPDETVDQSPTITTYTVLSGDTLSEIAEKFHISTNTLRWANDIPSKGTIKVGEELVILPFSGIQYTVKKGDTLSGIVAKYNGDTKEIMDVNDLESEKDIKPGNKLLIPDGEMPAVVPTKPAPTKSSTPKSTVRTDTREHVDATQGTITGTTSYFIMPLPNSILTQGLHAVNAVDLGAPIGTTVRAAADGKVIIAKQGGYNGGFGSYIVINHPNGTQTLYAHLSKVEVSVGQGVNQGGEIGKSGMTGKATGPHLHFETHGTKNPFARYPVGTHF